MAERGDASIPGGARDDRETLLEIARQITGTEPLRQGGGADMDHGEAAETGAFHSAVNGADRSFEDSPTGMAICADGEFIRANASFALALGYSSPDALTGTGGISAIFPDGNPAIVPAAPDGEARVTVNAMTRSRRRKKMSLAMHAIKGDAGEPVTLMVLHSEPAALNGSTMDTPAAASEAAPARDAKDDAASASSSSAPPSPEPPKRRASPKRKRDGRGEAEFLARVSHDIRTPLNSIIGFAQLMKAEQAGPLGNERYNGYVRDILESGEYALKLIDDLLVISRIEAEMFELNFASVDLNELVSECVAAAHAQAHKRRVFVRVALEESLPAILADRPTLERIVLNLLGNAITCCNPGGQAIIGSHTKSSGAVRLRVQDSGSGMSKAEIEQAMQPLVQRDTAPRLHFGNGLTLPLTKALAKANRAKFRLKSQTGHGTKITVTFPASRRAMR